MPSPRGSPTDRLLTKGKDAKRGRGDKGPTPEKIGAEANKREVRESKQGELVAKMKET